MSKKIRFSSICDIINLFRNRSRSEINMELALYSLFCRPIIFNYSVYFLLVNFSIKTFFVKYHILSLLISSVLKQVHWRDLIAKKQYGCLLTIVSLDNNCRISCFSFYWKRSTQYVLFRIVRGIERRTKDVSDRGSFVSMWSPSSSQRLRKSPISRKLKCLRKTNLKRLAFRDPLWI